MFAFPISSFLDSLDSSGVEDLINTTPHARSVERVRCEADKPSRTKAEKRERSVFISLWDPFFSSFY